MRLFASLAILTLVVVAGCTPPKAVSDLIESIPMLTSSVENPVKPNNIRQVKLTLQLYVKAGNKWADFCWSKTYRALMIDPVGKYVCVNRRETRRALFSIGSKAWASIKVAETFIINNPTLSPLNVIDDAWKAVQDYKSFVTPITP